MDQWVVLCGYFRILGPLDKQTGNHNIHTSFLCNCVYGYIQLPYEKKTCLLCIPFLYFMHLHQFDVLFYSSMFHWDDWSQKWFQNYACEQLYCWQILSYSCDCPACRTSLIATRFWVVVICPIIKCLTVLEFSFILFDLCLFITIFNFILNYVPIVTFWIFTYHKIWILLIIFCFIWNYWIIYFSTCLEAFWSVVS